MELGNRGAKALKVKPKEIWRLVNNYPNYEVSNFGRVRRIVGKILKPIKKRKGYLVVTMYANGRKQVGISRLVAGAFLGTRPNGYEINHKNGNKEKNDRYNLEYVTQLRNHRHAGELGLSSYKLSEKDVKEIRYLYADGYESQVRLAKRFGIHEAHIWKIIHRKKWKKVA